MRWRNSDSHIAAERVEETKQPIAGKAVKAAVQQSGHFGLWETQELAGRLLSKASLLDDLQNPGSQFGFCQVLFGIRNAKVSKHVAAAALDGFFAHNFPILVRVACTVRRPA